MKFLSWALEGAELLQPLLVMSLQGAVLVGAVLALRAVFARRMAPGVLYALWLLPAARLLIPGSIGSAFSFLNFIPKEMEAQAMAAAVMQTAVVQTPLDIPRTAVGRGLTVAVAGSGSSAPMTGLVVFNLAAILMLGWLLGMAAVLLYALWKNRAFRRRAMTGAVRVEVEACPLQVYLCENLSSPCLCGLLRPVILVNDGALENETYFALALRHELAHYCRKDRFFALLRLVCCAVHWFNPLVWVGAKASCEDCERACDARVLKDATTEERAVYGEMLLSFLCVPARRYSVLCTASPMGGGGKALRRRLTLIARRGAVKRTAAAMLALCVLLTCLVACTGRSGGGEAAKPDKEVYQKLARVADETEFVQYGISDGVHMAIGGKTLARYLDNVQWKECPGRADGTEIVAYQLLGESHAGNSITFVENEAGFCAHVLWNGAEEGEQAEAWYEISEADAGYAWAMSQIGGERTLYSTLPDGGEFVLVSSAPAMGYERHYLFYGEEGPKPTVYDYGTIYTPIYGDLDEQYARVAEEFCFVSERVGFVSFRFELYETAPDLFRTADGGKTWRRVALPMGDITEDNGYGAIHVTDISFEDEKNGAVTVSFSHSSTGGDDALSVVFTTVDGGETFTAVTSGGPAIRAASGETEGETVMRQGDPGGTGSAYLQEKEVTLEAGQQRQLHVIGITTALQWESDDAAVATVDEKGLVTAAAPGTTQVSVTWDGQRYDCSVTVTPANVTPAAEDDFKHVPIDNPDGAQSGTMPTDESAANLFPLLK